MASLTRKFTWKRWAPDIGENRELSDGPVLFLELATGLTAAQLHEMGEKLGAVREVVYESPDISQAKERDDIKPLLEAAKAAYLGRFRDIIVGALEKYVRVYQGPHTVDGEPLATLGDYIALLQQRADTGGRAVNELVSAIRAFNGVSGPDELFSLRSSGGARSTGDQRPAQEAEETVAH